MHKEQITRRHFVGLSALLPLCSSAWAAPVAAAWLNDFEKFVDDGLARTNVPGMSVAIVSGGVTLFAGGYGLANIATGRPVTADTAFHLASVSKVVTGLALMMLGEKGAFALDDPIGRYLDFPVANPSHPDAPITFRHLFTHTSSISDGMQMKGPLSRPGDPTLPLRDYLVGYLSPGGAWYDPKRCYFAVRPGREWQYSNVGIGLLGYLASRVSPETLDALTRRAIFEPLGLRRTGWHYSEIAAENLAVPYRAQAGTFDALPLPGYPDWPAGLLHSSANEFARILEIFTANGSLNGATFLKPDSVRQMLVPTPFATRDPAARQALIWELKETGDAHLAFKTGSDPGTASLVMFDIDRRAGALFFANGHRTEAFLPFQNELMQRMLDKARR